MSMKNGEIQGFMKEQMAEAQKRFATLQTEAEKTFKTWAADMKRVGVTRVEISAPWNLLEPEPGKYDLTFIPELSRQAIAAFHGHGIDLKTVILPCGHYTTGETPFKYMDAYHMVRFLAKNL